MNNEKIFKKVNKTIEELSTKLSPIINLLTNEIMKQDNGNNYEDKDFIQLTEVETLLFNSFGYLIKAKEATGVELTFPETMLRQEFDMELSEAMEMYREYRNTEEILNEGNEEHENKEDE